jgi:hypothetical protein
MPMTDKCNVGAQPEQRCPLVSGSCLRYALGVLFLSVSHTVSCLDSPASLQIHRSQLVL